MELKKKSSLVKIQSKNFNQLTKPIQKITFPTTLLKSFNFQSTIKLLKPYLNYETKKFQIIKTPL